VAKRKKEVKRKGREIQGKANTVTIGKKEINNETLCLLQTENREAHKKKKDLKKEAAGSFAAEERNNGIRSEKQSLEKPNWAKLAHTAPIKRGKKEGSVTPRARTGPTTTVKTKVSWI